jgi:hypothetical protein
VLPSKSSPRAPRRPEFRSRPRRCSFKANPRPRAIDDARSRILPRWRPDARVRQRRSTLPELKRATVPMSNDLNALRFFLRRIVSGLGPDCWKPSRRSFSKRRLSFATAVPIRDRDSSRRVDRRDTTSSERLHRSPLRRRCRSSSSELNLACVAALVGHLNKKPLGYRRPVAESGSRNGRVARDVPSSLVQVA